MEDIDNGCPICGREHKGDCNPRILRAIDAAHDAGWNDDHTEPRKPYYLRLRDGFDLLDNFGEDD